MSPAGRPEGEHRSAPCEATPLNGGLPAIAGARHLLVVVGPSGAGKDSVLAAWLALRPPGAAGPHLARRSITRPADAHEPHEALDVATFDALARSDAFATHWRAHGLHYGVRHAELAPLARGRTVVLNSSREHLPRLRAQAPGLSVVEITAPVHVRAQRLAGRAREDAAGVAARLQRALPPVHADFTLVNDSSLHEVAQALQRWWTARQRRT
jgi:ribose 1,5-bisphosphokinase